ncbi:hypothetical protein B566_EDAN002712 [Ephemera danica]|nr:hypothetical protein B566_EDAN002712 [Ephemera danica]
MGNSLCGLAARRKSTMQMYDPPYAKKPMPKKFAGKGPPANHSAEEAAAMESVNKILTFGNMPSYSRQDPQRVLFRPVNHAHLASAAGMSSARLQEHKMQQIKRLGASSGSEEDAVISGEEESVSFIDLPQNNMKLPEKGILKKSGPYGTVESREKWSEDSQSDNQEMMSSSDNNLVGADGGPMSEVERTLKSLNGYHEDILEALKTAASHRSGMSGGGGSQLGIASGSGLVGPSGLSNEELRKSLPDACYQEYAGEFPSSLLNKTSQERLALATQLAMATKAAATASAGDSGDEDTVPPCGTIRIRNLEDLIRQLEHHSTRHMSPSGSEDIRMSETDADRHYRLDSEGWVSPASFSPLSSSSPPFRPFLQTSANTPPPPMPPLPAPSSHRRMLPQPTTWHAEPSSPETPETWGLR